MRPEMGELLVGAYLNVFEGCQYVDYNVRPPGGGMPGLGELDVVGLDLVEKKAHLCEVTTHLDGLAYGSSNAETLAKIHDKCHRQREYATKYLRGFDPVYWFWSPVVPVGALTDGLREIQELEVVVNGDYSRCVARLQEEAARYTHDVGNDVFRLLQILAHMRG